MKKEIKNLINELKEKRVNIDLAIASLESLYGRNGMAEKVEVAEPRVGETYQLKEEGITLEGAVKALMTDGKARDSWDVAHELKKIGMKPKRQSVLACMSKGFIAGELTRVAKGIYQKPLSKPTV